MSALRPGHLELLCRDPRPLADFYLQLGFELTAWQGEDFCWLALGDLELLLRRGRPDPAPAEWSAQRCGLVLYTDDLPALLKRLAEAGIPVVAEDGAPECPLLRDPEGNWVQLVDPGRKD